MLAPAPICPEVKTFPLAVILSENRKLLDIPCLTKAVTLETDLDPNVKATIEATAIPSAKRQYGILLLLLFILMPALGFNGQDFPFRSKLTKWNHRLCNNQ